MNQRESKVIQIGLVGLGTVGTGVVKILQSQAGQIEKRTGLRLVLKRVCVKTLSKKRGVRLPSGILTSDVNALINDSSIQILVELIGGIHPAKEIIERAFLSGKHVVTANKALLAEHGEFLFKKAAAYGSRLGIEASVCGGIPIIQSIQEGLVSNEISQLMGIVNGTCNFILSSMSDGGVSFKEALAAAQRRGFAEKEPGLDVEGVDSAHKLAILARLSFQCEPDFRKIHIEGIQKLSPLDIQYAKELGYVIKLLAIGKKLRNGLELRVHPTMLPLDHPLSNVHGVYNAVFIHASQAGDLLFYGKGAGELPTASAVMGDILDIAKHIHTNTAPVASAPNIPGRIPILPINHIVSKYYLRFQVADKPGVLGKIAQILGKHGISILSVHQKESHDSKSVPVLILTYEASENNLRNALQEIDSKKEISEKTVLLRVEK